MNDSEELIDIVLELIQSLDGPDIEGLHIGLTMILDESPPTRLKVAGQRYLAAFEAASRHLDEVEIEDLIAARRELADAARGVVQ